MIYVLNRFINKLEPVRDITVSRAKSIRIFRFEFLFIHTRTLTQSQTYPKVYITYVAKYKIKGTGHIREPKTTTTKPKRKTKCYNASKNLCTKIFSFYY